jgi:release factor glutamine methyltransferase
VRVGAGRWFDALPADSRFDVIVSNPPYVADAAPELEASVAEWEPAGALFAGFDGLDAIRELVAGAPDHLADDGWLVVEIGADQGAAVRDLLVAAGYRDVEIRPDLAGRDRIAVGRRERSGAAR